MHARLKRSKTLGKPLVAAIHGHALGGGLEFAMACHYRVAVPTAKVGQPEVLLGIIPGAGGTQRLPRLCGPALALEMCTEGKPVAPPRALAAGIVDDVVDGDLLDGAIAFAAARVPRGRSAARHAICSDKIGDRAAGLAACQATRAALGKTARGARAPFAAVDAIEAAMTLDFDGRLATRDRAVRRLRPVDRVERHAPPVLRRARSGEDSGRAQGHAQPRDITRAAVIGAGTMGGGIAMAYANAGIPVLLKDVDQEALDRGLAIIRKNYESTIAKGKMTPEAMERSTGAHHADDDLRRLRRRRHRRRGGVREHGAEEVRVRRARPR